MPVSSTLPRCGSRYGDGQTQGKAGRVGNWEKCLIKE